MKEGQEVFVVYRNGRTATATVTKVGRTFGYLPYDRFRLEDGCQDDGRYSGAFQVYPSKEAYDAWQDLEKRRKNLERSITRKLTLEQVQAIEKILGI